ncbi:glycosyltransferase family 4 protein [Flagellimonas sp.]|uniref:glycosyltransferase family 4 protein n=1 Tax=Flagellimonas sp. TaxID=2058762 RepID=UPI003BA99457
MRIDLMMNSLPSGGAERVMSLLINGLAFKNHNVRFITFNEGQAFEIVKQVERIKLHNGKIKNHTIRSIFNLFKFYRIKSNRPDVLISFLPDNNLIAICVGKMLGIKVIVSEHTNHLVEVDKKTKWIQKNLYRYADATTVLTKFDKEYFSKFGAKVSVMPNPLNLPDKLKGFTKREKVILAIGGLDRYKIKGFDNLLNLIQPVLKENPNWSLKIVGHGEKGMQFLKHLTKKLNLENHVNFTGFHDDVQSLMQNSQIFVLTSRHEGLPMALMEALSNGMACISYDCTSGPRDLIRNNINGLLIEDQNITKMQASIISLIQNDSLREKLAHNAPDSVKPYKLENIINRWEKLIKFGHVD